jgi:hypothetical protein
MKKSIVLLLVCIVVFLSACQRRKIEQINDIVEVPSIPSVSISIENLVWKLIFMAAIGAPVYLWTNGYCDEVPNRVIRRPRAHAHHIPHYHHHDWVQLHEIAGG